MNEARNQRTGGGWNHAQCTVCWIQAEGVRVPHRLSEPVLETCCFCGHRTMSGIYRRVAPDDPRVRWCPGNQPPQPPISTEVT